MSGIKEEILQLFIREPPFGNRSEKRDGVMPGMVNHGPAQTQLTT